MKLLSAFSLLSLSAAASAHTIFTTLYVDGVSQGDATGVRMRHRGQNKVVSAPVPLDNEAIACGFDGEVGNPRVIPVNDGSTLTFEFRSKANDPSKGAIAPSHRGPCSIYLKKVDNAAADNNAQGDGWFKLWEEGYDADEKTWCTNKLGNGVIHGPYNQTLSVTLPKGLQGGYYLARPELLALHQVPGNNDPQFFTGCAQIFLESDGNKVPKETVKIPGYVSKDDPSVTFNIYKDPLNQYTMPGPAVAELVEGKAGITEQDEGLEPEGCILANAGWCAFETKEYTDENGCLESEEDCLKQSKDCLDWADKYPTGRDPWCKIWSDKCDAISAACKAKDFNGPPNKGKVLTPPAAIIEPVMPKGTTIKSDIA